MGMRAKLKQVLYEFGLETHRPPLVQAANAFRHKVGRRAPWSGGYVDYRNRFTAAVLADPARLAPFRSGALLPPQYGVGLDERCIEWPWFFACAGMHMSEYLDVGATLNHAHLLRHPFWQDKRLTILTLSPESDCFWRLGISYHFSDLRTMPFQRGWFDEIVCLSTLEHVGMDNSFYSPASEHRQQNTRDFESAVLELRRVLKPGGRLLISVPFGKYQNWGFFQQFDAALLDRAAEVFAPTFRKDAFYRYQASGWQIASREDCQDCGFSEYMLSLWVPNLPPRKPDSDLAAAARAVACCIWQRD